MRKTNRILHAIVLIRIMCYCDGANKVARSKNFRTKYTIGDVCVCVFSAENSNWRR